MRSVNPGGCARKLRLQPLLINRRGDPRLASVGWMVAQLEVIQAASSRLNW